MITQGRLAWLAVAGVAAIGLALWATTAGHREESLEAGGKVLPDLAGSVNSVTELHLFKGDGTHTTLTKLAGGTAGPAPVSAADPAGAAGASAPVAGQASAAGGPAPGAGSAPAVGHAVSAAGGWVVGERGYPADSGLIRKLLLDLADLSVVEEKTSDPALYAQLGVEDVTSVKAGGTEVDIVRPGSTSKLIVGKPSGTGSFMRVAGRPVSLLAKPQLSPDADPRRWLDHGLIDLPAERIKSVDLAPEGGPAYGIARADARQQDFTVSPLPKGRELTGPGAATPIASGLADLTLDDVRRNALAVGSEHATFKTFDGLAVEITGSRDGDRRYLVVSARAGAPAVQAQADAINARTGGWDFEVPSYKYDAIFRKLDDLLKKPEKPAAPAKSAKQDVTVALPKAAATAGAAGRTGRVAGKAPLHSPSNTAGDASGTPPSSPVPRH